MSNPPTRSAQSRRTWITAHTPGPPQGATSSGACVKGPAEGSEEARLWPQPSFSKSWPSTATAPTASWPVRRLL